MKQPLMVVPPAQAEALYDAALADEQRGVRARSQEAHAAGPDWDDRESVESYDVVDQAIRASQASPAKYARLMP